MSQTYLATQPTSAQSADRQSTQTAAQPRIHRLGSMDVSPKFAVTSSTPMAPAVKKSDLPPLPTPVPIHRPAQLPRVTVTRGKSLGIANRLVRKASRRPHPGDVTVEIKPFDSPSPNPTPAITAATSLSDDTKKFEAAVISAEARSGNEPPVSKQHSSIDSATINMLLNNSVAPLKPDSSPRLQTAGPLGASRPVTTPTAPVFRSASVRRDATVQSASHHHRRSSSSSVYSEKASIKSPCRAEREWRARVAALGATPFHARSSVMMGLRGGPVPPKRSPTPGRVFIRGMSATKLAGNASDGTPSRSTGTPFSSLGSTPESDKVITPAHMSTTGDHLENGASAAPAPSGQPSVELSAAPAYGVEMPLTPARSFQSGKSFDTLGFHRTQPADQTRSTIPQIVHPTTASSGLSIDAVRSVSASSYTTSPSPIPYRVLQLQDRSSAVRERKASVPLSVSSVARSVSSFYFDNNASHVSTRPSSFAISNLRMPVDTPTSSPERKVDRVLASLPKASTAGPLNTGCATKGQVSPETHLPPHEASGKPSPPPGRTRQSPIATVALKASLEDIGPPAATDPTNVQHIADTVVKRPSSDAHSISSVQAAPSKSTGPRITIDASHRTPPKRRQHNTSLGTDVLTSPTTSYLLTAPIESISWSLQLGQETPEELRPQAHPYARVRRSVEGGEPESGLRMGDMEEIDEDDTSDTAEEDERGNSTVVETVPGAHPMRSKLRLPPSPPILGSRRSGTRRTNPTTRFEFTDDIFKSPSPHYPLATLNDSQSTAPKSNAQPMHEDIPSALRNRRQIPPIELHVPASRQTTNAYEAYTKPAPTGQTMKPVKSKLGHLQPHRSYSAVHGPKKDTSMKGEILRTGVIPRSQVDLTPGMETGERPPKAGLPMAVSSL